MRAWKQIGTVDGVGAVPGVRLSDTPDPHTALIILPGSGTRGLAFAERRLDDLRTTPIDGVAVFCLTPRQRGESGKLGFGHDRDGVDQTALRALIEQLRDHGVTHIGLGGESYGASATWASVLLHHDVVDLFAPTNCSIRTWVTEKPYHGQLIHHELGLRDGSVAVAVETERSGVAGHLLPDRAAAIWGEAGATMDWIGADLPDTVPQGQRAAAWTPTSPTPGINRHTHVNGSTVCVGHHWGHVWRSRPQGWKTHRQMLRHLARLRKNA